MSCTLHNLETGVEQPLGSHAAEELVINESVHACVAATNGKARAIVLTGSMSRGEASFKEEAGGWRVLGDATFLIVLDGRCQLVLSQLQQQIEAALLQQGLSCRVVIITCTVHQLQRMKPSIYAYELRERGRVVWGDENALNIIPGFTTSDIPKEDGWWLLCNRMIEQLEAAAECQGTQDATALRYRLAKLYLAMAACYLLLIEQYEPSYSERARRLQTLAERDGTLNCPIPLQRFSEVVSLCTELKLHGDIQVARDVFPQWNDVIADAEKMWQWALSDMLSGGDSTELLRRLAARQPLFARAKAWLRAVYIKPSSLRQNWARWAAFMFSTSPRYLVYGAASDLLFRSSEHDTLTPEQLDEIVRRLPLTSDSDSQITWRFAAKQVAHNFHLFVDSTRS